MDYNEELRKLADEYAGRGDARLWKLINGDRIRQDKGVYRSDRVGRLGNGATTITELKEKLIQSERQAYLRKM